MSSPVEAPTSVAQTAINTWLTAQFITLNGFD